MNKLEIRLIVSRKKKREAPVIEIAHDRAELSVHLVLWRNARHTPAHRAVKG